MMYNILQVDNVIICTTIQETISYVHVYILGVWADNSTSQKTKLVFPNVVSSSRARSSFPELPVICESK